MFTTDKNAQLVLSLLKEYGIKKIVVSPGWTNVPISMTVQNDPWFEVYSVVDERSAAYFATGLAFESNEPVVISCTGATASRNYIPALTEAYYRNIPIIALTSQAHINHDIRNFAPQSTDRSVSQNDIKKISVMLPHIKDQKDYNRCEVLINDALIKATTKGNGPVHINLPVNHTDFSIDQEQIDVTKIEYYDEQKMTDDIALLRKELLDKKIGILIGAHNKFSESTTKAMNDFIDSYNVVVFTDHTSNYVGRNQVVTGRIFDLLNSKNDPDIWIDMGSVTGDYSVPPHIEGKNTWRISENGEIVQRNFEKVQKIFDCKEEFFFNSLSDKKSKNSNQYYKEICKELKRIKIPDIPLSNTFIAGELAKNIPKKSSLHLGILNSLRNMNFYELDQSIDSTANVGGFGIDGPISTIIGQSMVDKEKIYFGLVGDLAFFYDMNALGIRHISNNVRIILVNNGLGAEFRVNPSLEQQFGEKTNKFIAAEGHNGSAKAWAKSMGFEYITADSKEQFSKQIKGFCSSDVDAFSKPVIFEVFTTAENEQIGLDLIRLENNA